MLRDTNPATGAERGDKSLNTRMKNGVLIIARDDKTSPAQLTLENLSVNIKILHQTSDLKVTKPECLKPCCVPHVLDYRTLPIQLRKLGPVRMDLRRPKVISAIFFELL